MKNKKGIIIGTLVLLIVGVVGYSLFSETVNINGTANAEGNFSYKLEGMVGINPEVKSNNLYGTNWEYGYTVDTINFGDESGSEGSVINVNGNRIETNTKLELNKKQYYTIKITNTGSLPIEVAQYDHDWNALFDKVTYNISGNIIMSDGGLVDVNDVKKAVDGYPTKYKFDLADWRNLESLKSQMSINYYELFVSEEVYNEYDSRINEEILPGEYDSIIFKPGDVGYMIIYTGVNNITLPTGAKGLDVVVTSEFNLPIMQSKNK